MNFLRVRVVKLSRQYGAPEDRPYAVQISTSGLEWWPLNLFPDAEAAISAAKGLTEFVRSNMLLMPSHILWKDQL